MRTRSRQPLLRTRRERRMLGLLVLVLVGVVAACWVTIALLGAFPGDAASAAEVREERFGWVVLGPARALGWIGKPGPFALIAAGLAAWAWRRIGWRHGVLVIAALGVSPVAWIIKEIVQRPRPHGAGLASASFPSGHTSLAMAVLGVVAILAVQRRSWRLATASVLVAGAMGPSRVLLGVHWASDVLAGYAVGLLWAIAVLLVGLPWARQDVDQRQHPPATR